MKTGFEQRVAWSAATSRVSAGLNYVARSQGVEAKRLLNTGIILVRGPGRYSSTNPGALGKSYS